MTIVYDYVIIGGGITGLTAAHTLQRIGHTVLLLEGPSPGGEIQTTSLDGFTLELGANTFVLIPEVTTLLSALDLDSAISRPSVERFQQYIFHNGLPTVAPRTPFALLRTPLFSISEKFRLFFGFFKKAPFDSKRFMSVKDLFDRYVGTSFTRTMLDPVLRGIFGGDVAKLDASAIFPTLFDHLSKGDSLFSISRRAKKRKIFRLHGGNARVTKALQDRIVNRRQLSVKAIRFDNNTFETITDDGAFYATRCVVATSGTATAEFIGDLYPALGASLQKLRYAPIAVVHCAIPAATVLPKDGFGVLFPTSCPARMIGVLFNSLLFPHTAPRDSHLLTVCFGGIQSSDTLLENDLTEITVDELGRYFNFKGVKVLSTSMWSRAIPQYEEEFQPLQKTFQECEEKFPGLFFIGADRGGVGVPDRIRWATTELLDRVTKHQHRA